MILNNSNDKIFIFLEILEISLFMSMCLDLNVYLANKLCSLLNMPFNFSISLLGFGIGYEVIVILMIIEFIFIVSIIEFFIPKFCHWLVWH